MRSLLLSALVATLCVADASDRILPGSLPGWNGPQDMYAGYINVNSSHGRNLFYWLVESAGDPSNDPLVLWTNGGPGCSGIAGGLFSELGPFFPNTDGSLGLTPNPYSWTSSANVIFIEQPSGVGFSFSDTPADYTTGDYQSAADVYAFLLSFMERYPQYANRTLYLSGESYGGHYVPSFAKTIVEGNAAGVHPRINLAGFLVGNAWTVAELDNVGAVDFWLSRTAISQDIHDGIIATCNMSDVGPLAAGRVRAEADWEVAQGLSAPLRPLGFTPLFDAAMGVAKVSGGANCDGWSNQGFGLLSGIDIYDVYDNVCTASTPSSSVALSPIAATKTPTATATAKTLPDSNNAAGCSQTFDACRDDKTSDYLNTPAVKEAIHANASIVWRECSNVIDYSRFDLLSSMLPVYNELIAAKLRILVYSGDVDAIVPSIGSRAWIAALNSDLVSPIRAWTLDGQIGGWTTQYAGLNFTTVRNAGHFVPELQGSRALALFNAFINNLPL